MSNDADQFIDWLVENRGGIGPKTAENIRDEFPDSTEFVDACKRAYDDREWDSLTDIDGIGKGYAHGKLALGAAEYFGWSGGDAEPVEIDVMTGDEVLDEVDGPVQPIVLNDDNGGDL